MTESATNATPPPGPPHDARTETHSEPGRGPHGAASDHGDGHGHDDHAHGVEPLGPIDVRAWGAGALGVGVAVLTAVCFALATAPAG